MYEQLCISAKAFGELALPDLPGCVATGSTKEEVEHSLREAIALHLEGLKAEGLSIPKPDAWVESIEV